MSKFAFTTYEQVSVNLRSYLRGGELDLDTFINEMKLTDEMIIDLCPLIDKLKKTV